MLSATHDRSMRPSGPAPLKRPSSQLALPLDSPSKRPKLSRTPGTESSTLLSPSLPIDGAVHFKAEKWFDDTNKDASQHVPYLDNEQPFYITQQSLSGDGTACTVDSDSSSFQRSMFGQPTAPTRSLLARMESSESNSGDFRSVIDDLTIQNKKLKQKLRKYEVLHCSHLQEEKLFEVRIHGLAAHQKRELEETLRSFASSIEELSPDRPVFAPIPTQDSAQGLFANLQMMGQRHSPSTEPMSALRKPSSASTSCSKPVDSAYASMSGQTGNSQAQIQETSKYDTLTQASQRQRNVKSYLHDIPETSKPKHSLAMSERSKSKLVVKRLEQIFTGKGAARHQHNQSHQQQEVSQSAAQADRSRLGSQGRGRQIAREGLREARILRSDAELQVDNMSETNWAAQPSRQSSNDGRYPTPAVQASRDASPDQRPTRPLDLDLRRAQIPSDNIGYIRHLGLASSATGVDVSPDAQDGWIYLNLLTSMAQLHTLNVTPEFIRHAVADISSRFELSPDGSRVRWRGGTEGTHMSSDSGESEDFEKAKSATTSLAVSKCGSFTDLHYSQDPNNAPHKLPTPNVSDKDELGVTRMPVPIGQVNTRTEFHYKPLFFHATPSKQDNNSAPTSNSSSLSDPLENAPGMNSGIISGSHGLWDSEVKLRKQNTENGPIIFYHKARFCTDLSGDPSSACIEKDAYPRYTQDPIGWPPRSLDETPTETVPNDTSDRMEVDFDSTGAIDLLVIDDLESCISESVSSTNPAALMPMAMEASGLGGVQPDDNFVVNIQIQHLGKRKRTSHTESPSSTPRRRVDRALNGIFQRSRDSLQTADDMIPTQSTEKVVDSEIISELKTDLAPSSLPQPSYVCLAFSSSESEDMEDDDEPPVNFYNNSSRSFHQMSVEGIAVRPTDFLVGSSSEESKGFSYVSTSCGSDDDSSIDLLAHARELDPDAIATYEREYDTIAIPPPEGTPIGSSAATAGASSELATSGSVPTDVIGKGESDVDSMSVEGDGGTLFGW